MATIEIARAPAPWRDRARSYRVLIDGRQVGTLRQGDTATYTVEPGSHDVQMRIDWCSSRSVSAEVAADGTARLVCRPGDGSWTALLDAVFQPGSYILLEAVRATEAETNRPARRELA